MILDQLARHAQEQAHRTAFIYNGARLSYRTFAQLIEQNRRVFARAQLPPGSTAIIVIQNLAQAWIALLALRALGLTTLSLIRRDTRMVLANVSCVVTTAEEYNPAVVQEHMAPGAQLIVLPMETYSLSTAARINAYPRSSPVPNGHICLSTGTTGAPKKMLYSQDKEEGALNALRDHFEMDRDFIYNGMNRALYTGSLYKNLLATWHAGGCVALDQTSDPFQSCRSGRQHVSVPQAVLRNFLRGAPKPVGNPDATYRIGGGLYFDEAVAAKTYLSARVKNSYGLTEVVLNPLDSWVETPEDVIWLRPNGTNEIEVVDQEDRPVPPGTEGFLRIRLHPFDCHEYLGDPAFSAQVFRDGYVYPGDLATQRADGRVRILGRVSEVIVSKTAKFAVGPVERDLRAALQARAVALFARRRLDTEDELVAVVEGDRSPAEGEIRAVVRDFALFERISSVAFDRFPTTPNGKIDRLALREAAFRRLDATDP